MSDTQSENTITRRKTRQITVGGVKVGGDAPVSVQSMTNTDTRDVKATVDQIRQLDEAGCEIVRLAVPDEEAGLALKAIREAVCMPLIADIHFDHKLALMALEAGFDCLRLNPGNIGSKERIKEVVLAAKDKNVPIRIGVNAGSLEKDILKAHGGHSNAKAMVESAARHIEILENLDFSQIKVSLKASDVMKTVNAYRLFSEKFDYPTHIGVTEAGTTFGGTIKSSIGLGILLNEGIGDTMRVSLTANPTEEVKVAFEILKGLEIRKRGVNIKSCPTCGRIEIDCEKIATAVESRLSHIKEPLNVAIMGCVVNGPGESKEAHIGICGGRGEGLIYVDGEVVKKVTESEIIDSVVAEVEGYVKALENKG